VKTQLGEGWPPAQRAFRGLLNWLDDSVDSGGEKYLEMHRRLAFYFARKNCLTPADLADETLTRVLRRLEEDDAVKNMPATRFCYITARYVFLEHLRRADHRQISLDGVKLATPAAPDDETTARSKQLDSLDRCLAKLNPEHRDLIFEYYRGERQEKIQRRRQLAGRLGLSMNALTIRASRIREKLEACMKT
jgi:RNA polymerase sigma factor (sigma-70 family)